MGIWCSSRAALAIALAACASSPPPIAQVAPAPAPPVPSAAVEPEPRTVELFAEWDHAPREEFEIGARAWLAGGARVRLHSESVTELTSALAQGGERSVRAAILLAKSGDPRAHEVLLVRLEQRLDREADLDPTGDACDVVAAAALRAPDPSVRECGARLEALATSPKPHPDLEVRVECAVSALALGRTRTIAFLLRVLREGTSAQTARVDWKRGGDITFAQTRAADALARYAGVASEFSPHASMAARAAEADRLERILTPPRPKQR
jgi:hypothetical protein